MRLPLSKHPNRARAAQCAQIVHLGVSVCVTSHKRHARRMTVVLDMHPETCPKRSNLKHATLCDLRGLCTQRAYGFTYATLTALRYPFADTRQALIYRPQAQLTTGPLLSFESALRSDSIASRAESRMMMCHFTFVSTVRYTVPFYLCYCIKPYAL